MESLSCPGRIETQGFNPLALRPQAAEPRRFSVPRSYDHDKIAAFLARGTRFAGNECFAGGYCTALTALRTASTLAPGSEPSLAAPFAGLDGSRW